MAPPTDSLNMEWVEECLGELSLSIVEGVGVQDTENSGGRGGCGEGGGEKGRERERGERD